MADSEKSQVIWTLNKEFSQEYGHTWTEASVHVEAGKTDINYEYQVDWIHFLGVSALALYVFFIFVFCFIGLLIWSFDLVF